MNARYEAMLVDTRKALAQVGVTVTLEDLRRKGAEEVLEAEHWAACVRIAEHEPRIPVPAKPKWLSEFDDGAWKMGLRSLLDGVLLEGSPLAMQRAGLEQLAFDSFGERSGGLHDGEDVVAWADRMRCELPFQCSVCGDAIPCDDTMVFEVATGGHKHMGCEGTPSLLKKVRHATAFDLMQINPAALERLLGGMYLRSLGDGLDESISSYHSGNLSHARLEALCIAALDDTVFAAVTKHRERVKRKQAPDITAPPATSPSPSPSPEVPRQAWEIKDLPGAIAFLDSLDQAYELRTRDYAYDKTSMPGTVLGSVVERLRRIAVPETGLYLVRLAKLIDDAASELDDGIDAQWLLWGLSDAASQQSALRRTPPERDPKDPPGVFEAQVKSFEIGVALGTMLLKETT